MQPVRLTIPGDFWDCQIYSGRLYLWRTDGALLIYDWDSLVDSLTWDQTEKFVLTCALSRGDYLYTHEPKMLFSDPDISRLLKRKFESISLPHRSWEASDRLLDQHLLGTQSNPFEQLPVDTDILSNRLYAATDQGLMFCDLNRQKRRKTLVTPEPVQVWDAPLFSVKARGSCVALGAGREGLCEFSLWNWLGEDGEWVQNHAPSDFFEYEDREWAHETDSVVIEPLWPRKLERGIRQLSPNHCSSANWSYASIYSSSYVEDGYLATFQWRRSGNRFQRAFQGIVTQSEIFQPGGFSWGCQDKIYRVAPEGLDVVRYTQRYVGTRHSERTFEDLEHIPFQAWKGNLIGGGASCFGVIVECENAIVVLKSDGEPFNIPGSATRWRVYPRSHRYETHLHVVLDDRLEIYSFTHDYFVDQWEKNAGVRYR